MKVYILDKEILYHKKVNTNSSLQYFDDEHQVCFELHATFNGHSILEKLAGKLTKKLANIVSHLRLQYNSLISYFGITGNAPNRVFLCQLDSSPSMCFLKIKIRKFLENSKKIKFLKKILIPSNLLRLKI